MRLSSPSSGDTYDLPNAPPGSAGQPSRNPGCSQVSWNLRAAQKPIRRRCTGRTTTCRWRYDSCCVNLVQIEPPLRRRDDVEVASPVEKFRIGAASARRDVFRVEIKPLLRPVPLLEVLNVPILKQPLTCAVIRPGSISSAEITSYNRTSGPE